MFTVILFLLAGIGIGFCLRKRNTAKKIRATVTVLIWTLLFLLGVEVGGNERIVRGLHTLGFEAVVLAAGGTAGSVLAAWGLWRTLQRRKGGGA